MPGFSAAGPPSWVPAKHADGDVPVMSSLGHSSGQVPDHRAEREQPPSEPGVACPPSWEDDMDLTRGGRLKSERTPSYLDVRVLMSGSRWVTADPCAN